MKKDTVGSQLADALVHFPAYVISWTIGLLIIILSDVTVTTVALLGVFVGFATDDVFWGLSAFTIAYVALRAVGILADATNLGLRTLAVTIRDKE